MIGMILKRGYWLQIIMCVAAALAATAIVLGGARPLAAASNCPATALRWASSSNTLYADGAATVCTPADIQVRYPTRMVKVSDGVYLLKVNLKLTGGASLQVVGTSAGGTTNQLRLLSNNNGQTTGVINVTADHGNIMLQHTKVTSWNEAANGPDTEYATSRAYMRVRSREVSGVANTSRMDILNSDVGYLGYYAAESYGLTWKVLGTGVFDRVDVLGDIKNSRIHHNYFGVYTYGAYGMVIDNNEVDSNVQYGIDPHDDSDSLTITNNRSHHNGNHGIICSQRCDHITVSGNQSYNNVGHGIMLHRSVDFSVVENNTVKSNTDAGIALFESNNNLVRGNYLEGNRNTLRLSVGASDNRFENNTIASSTQYGVYTYQGSDAPMRPGNDGINRRNVWIGNKVAQSKTNIMKLGATNGDRFENNDFRNNPGVKFNLTGAKNTQYINNQTDPGVSLP
jgi:mannuronan 5-epimerase